jgi:hypothetical protein
LLSPLLGTERMRIDASGNVFVNGTTQIASSKLNVIGTGAYIGVGGTVEMLFGDSGSSEGFLGTFTNHPLALRTNNTERMIINSSGTVGIGTSSPDTTTKLTVAGAITVTGANTGHGASRLKLGQDTSAISQIRFYGADNSTAGILQFTGSSADSTVGGERMRIDASGNLLVGKTAAGIANAGSEFSSTGRAFFTFDNGGPLQLNRLNNDGDIIELHKDGTEVGSIGALSSRLYIGTAETGLFFNNSSGAITPFDVDGLTQTDADVDLGVGSIRFKDLYLSGGVYLGGTGSANHAG